MNISGIQSTRAIMDAYYVDCINTIHHLGLLDLDADYAKGYARTWNRAIAYARWYEAQQGKQYANSK